MARHFTRSVNQYLYADGPFFNGMPFTVSAWFYPTSLLPSEQNSIVSGRSPTIQGDYWILDTIDDPYGSNTNWRLVGQVAAANVQAFARSSNTLVVNQWHHCGLTAAITQRDVFLNGVKTSYVETLAAWTSPMSLTTIGSYRSETGVPALQATGRIANVGLWTGLLTDAEMAALAQGVAPPFIRPSNLVGYFPLFGDDPATERNYWAEPGYPSSLIAVNAPPKARHPRTLLQWASLVGDAESAGWGPLLGQQRSRLVIQP